MIFDSLKSFLGAGTYLGVDIGTTSIKIAELTRIGGGPKLTNYGILDTYGHLTRLNNAIQTSSLKIAARETAEMVETLVKKGNFKTRDAIVSVPAFSSFTIFFDLPAMSNEETAKVLQYQIPQYIPMPIEEASIDWMKVGEKDNEKGFTDQQIVVVAIPKEIVSLRPDKGFGLRFAISRDNSGCRKPFNEYHCCRQRAVKT
ncbi:MAG: pilus assembly protein PilM [Candidatus Wolfebacteria bacterium]|nr:pilus assembly protein PilM [Candidatus Wolfebacteria bacterium]